MGACCPITFHQKKDPEAQQDVDHLLPCKERERERERFNHMSIWPAWPMRTSHCLCLKSCQPIRSESSLLWPRGKQRMLPKALKWMLQRKHGLAAGSCCLVQTPKSRGPCSTGVQKGILALKRITAWTRQTGKHLRQWYQAMRPGRGLTSP